ncbi:hypothetical protein [Vreelandella zhaodongensis]|uniref:hypothetical protein n=1 Tax=Vreelandella zhaodongensis TaxID=1176240 RepID=UPI003EBCE861
MTANVIASKPAPVTLTQPWMGSRVFEGKEQQQRMMETPVRRLSQQTLIQTLLQQ